MHSITYYFFKIESRESCAETKFSFLLYFFLFSCPCVKHRLNYVIFIMINIFYSCSELDSMPIVIVSLQDPIQILVLFLLVMCFFLHHYCHFIDHRLALQALHLLLFDNLESKSANIIKISQASHSVTQQTKHMLQVWICYFTLLKSKRCST